MAIYRLLKNSPLQPEEIARITKAYEQALHTLGVKERDDPLTELIAKNVIKIAQTCVHDVAQLSALAITGLARISHRKWRIGAPNQRKFFCEKDFQTIRRHPDADRV